MSKPKKETVLKAIKGSGGIMSSIAKRLKVDWHTAKTYVNMYEDTKQAYANEEEAILDMADAGLYKGIKNGDMTAIKWIQVTKGKKRGYVERKELTGAEGTPLQPPTADLSNVPLEILLELAKHLDNSE